jgi:hypothetical protein
MSWPFEVQDRDIDTGQDICTFCGSEVYADMGYCVECDAQLGSPISAERPSKYTTCAHEDAPCCGCDPR